MYFVSCGSGDDNMSGKVRIGRPVLELRLLNRRGEWG